MLQDSENVKRELAELKRLIAEQAINRDQMMALLLISNQSTTDPNVSRDGDNQFPIRTVANLFELIQSFKITKKNHSCKYSFIIIGFLLYFFNFREKLLIKKKQNHLHVYLTK